MLHRIIFLPQDLSTPHSFDERTADTLKCSASGSFANTFKQSDFNQSPARLNARDWDSPCGGLKVDRQPYPRTAVAMHAQEDPIGTHDRVVTQMADAGLVWSPPSDNKSSAKQSSLTNSNLAAATRWYSADVEEGVVGEDLRSAGSASRKVLPHHRASEDEPAVTAPQQKRCPNSRWASLLTYRIVNTTNYYSLFAMNLVSSLKVSMRGLKTHLSCFVLFGPSVA